MKNRRSFLKGLVTILGGSLVPSFSLQAALPVVPRIVGLAPPTRVEDCVTKIYIDNAVGYKGSTELDAGYFYCPYLPLMRSGVLE